MKRGMFAMNESHITKSDLRATGLLFLSALFLLLLSASSSSSYPSFVTPPVHLSTFVLSDRCNIGRASVASRAAAASKRKGGKKSGGGGGGKGGFGSGNSNSNNKPKTRSVSGYTGSGTKALRDAANAFDEIRKRYGKEATSDVYMRSPLNDMSTFWFVGKVVRRLVTTAVNGEEENDDGDATATTLEAEVASDVSPAANTQHMVGTTAPTEFDAVLSQKRLIIEYAKNQLRPQNFGGPFSKDLELWIAPGDSEMDVVQNKVILVKVTGSASDLSEGFAVADVGFNPEIYVGDEIKDGGLRVVRDEEGRPIKPVFEVNR